MLLERSDVHDSLAKAETQAANFEQDKWRLMEEVKKVCFLLIFICKEWSSFLVVTSSCDIRLKLFKTSHNLLMILLFTITIDIFYDD